MKTETRGGAREGAGRKKNDEPTIRVQFMLEKDDFIKLRALGGGKWLKRQIKRAKVLNAN
jgi:hypothetical protein